MDGVSTGSIIGAALFTIAQIIILIGCIIIAVKQKSKESYIMLLGIILMILVSLLGTDLIVSYTGNPQKILDQQIKLSVLTGLANLIFGIGLILLAINSINKKSKNDATRD